MRADPRSEQDNAHGVQPVIQELRLFASWSEPTALPEDHFLISGGVHANMRDAGEHFYGEPSETLIRGIPIPRAAPPPDPPPIRPQLSAKDLIAELHSINTQIHRMMFQVERAVAKLATTG